MLSNMSGSTGQIARRCCDNSHTGLFDDIDRSRQLRHERAFSEISEELSFVLALCLIVLLIASCLERSVFGSDQSITLKYKIEHTEWEKIRGANFIPSYASNTYEIWRNYNHGVFDGEMGLVQKVGYNSVRLWLNYDAYAELGTVMVDHVEDALRICARHHLRAVVVLFDSCGIRPRKDAKWLTASDAFDEFQNSSRFTAEQKTFMAALFKNYVQGFARHTLVPVGSDTPFMALLWQNWQSTPGNNRLGADWYSKLEDYVDAIVSRSKNNPSVLLWDLMNEPEFASEGFLSANVLITPEMQKIRDDFLQHFHQHLKENYPDEIVSVGWASLENAKKYSELADLITFHVYGDAAQLSAAIRNAQEFSEKSTKRILITETLANWDFGKSDFGAMATDEAQLAHYREVLPVLIKSPIGWIGWGMVISRDFDPYTDIFYPNGIPRPSAVFLEKSMKAAEQEP